MDSNLLIEQLTKIVANFGPLQVFFEASGEQCVTYVPYGAFSDAPYILVRFDGEGGA